MSTPVRKAAVSLATDAGVPLVAVLEAAMTPGEVSKAQRQAAIRNTIREYERELLAKVDPVLDAASGSGGVSKRSGQWTGWL